MVHCQALRAIATVCCVTECIDELEKVGGVSSLSDILSNETVSEGVRSEAAGVVAQITSPCLDQYHNLAGFLEHMDDLVKSLTGKTRVKSLISKTMSPKHVMLYRFKH